MLESFFNILKKCFKYEKENKEDIIIETLFKRIKEGKEFLKVPTITIRLFLPKLDWTMLIDH